MAWARVGQCIFQTNREVNGPQSTSAEIMMLSKQQQCWILRENQSFTQWVRNSMGRGSAEPCNPEQDLGSIKHLISKF